VKDTKLIGRVRTFTVNRHCDCKRGRV